MRRTLTLMLLAAFLSCIGLETALAQGKKIHIVANNEPIASVFKKLEKQTAYKVMYASADVYGVKVNKTIDAPDINGAMDQIVSGTGLTYTIDKQFVTVKKASEAVTASDGEGDYFVMNGRVYDEAALDLPGVTVMIVGTDKGTATDVDGRFTLNVKAGMKLKFSYIGYRDVIETVKANNNRRTMKVTMLPDSKNLDEVQVVAFGTQKKESVVSSITTVNPGDLKSSSSDLTTSFAGKIPGMIAWQTGGMPGALTESDMNTKFYVRGITSFATGANTDPLILLDGVESSKLDLARVNVDDIESFSVLKDASATAMYGARGANGVIIVTTKKGAEGNVYTTTHYECVISEPTKELEVADPITYMKYYNQAIMGRSNSGVPKYTQERIANTGNPNYPSWLYPANDWYKILFKDVTVNHRAGVTIRGGGRKVQYYASFNYNYDQGMLKSDKLNDFNVNIRNHQFNFRTNMTIELNVGMQLQINSATNIDRYHGPYYDQTSAYSYAFYASPVDFAALYPADATYSWPHLRFGTTSSSATNPYMLNQMGYKEQTRYSTTNRVEFQHKLNRWIPGLEYRLIAAVQNVGYYQNRFVTKPYSYYLNSYDYETGEFTLAPSYSNAYASRTLSLDNEVHSTDTRTTLEARIYHTAAWGGENNNMHQTAFTAIAQVYDRTSTPNSDVLEAMPQRNATFSGRFSYGFLDRYFAEASCGYNGSERFSKDHRWGFFPALGAAWVTSSEPWMQGIKKWIPYLKFRFSWGKVGNDGISSDPRYVYLPDIGTKVQTSTGIIPNNTSPYERNIVNFYGDPDIEWEVNEQYNLGLEMKLFGGLFETQVDIYRAIRHNIIDYRLTIPANVGIEAAPLDNIGETDSRGIDISGKIQHMFSNDFWFILNGTLTYNRVKYRYIEEATDKPEWQRKKGHEISQPIGYIAEGLFRDQAEIDNSPRQDGDVMPGDIKYRDLNGDGQIDVNDATFIGYPETPRLIYGTSLFVNYKQFEFSTSFQGSGKRSFFINAPAISPFVNDHALLKVIADDHWSEDNQAERPFWPRLSTSNITYHNPQEMWSNTNGTTLEQRRSTYFMRSCRFLRCTSISLAYNLPVSIVHRLGLKNVKFQFATYNPFMFSSFKLWDVELGGNAFSYPIQRTYMASLQVNF